jgi:hypothetical protein
VNIRFVVDGNLMELKGDFKMGFIKQKDTIFGVIEEDKFLLPDGVKDGDKLSLFFLNSKYSLLFKSFTIVINAENPLWEIGVDEKPFDRKKHWSIKKWRKVKLVYYIQDSNGGRLTICKT